MGRLWYTGMLRQEKRISTHRFCQIVSKNINPSINNKIHFYYRPRSEGDNALGSVCLLVYPSVCAFTVEPFGLRPPSFALRSTLTLARLDIYYLKVVGQRSKSSAKNRVFNGFYLALKSRSQVNIKFLVRSGRY